jgi:hypothetical protein
MAGKTRRIKKGGSPCLFILEDVLASISKLVKNIQKISDKKEVEKKREIKQSFVRDIYIVFMTQINASCSDIKPKKYEEFLKKIGNLMTAFREKREQLDELGDIDTILNKIDDMIEHGSQLMERVDIEPVAQTAISSNKSKKSKKSKKESKKVKNVNISPDSEGLTEPEEQIISADDIVLTTAESPPKSPSKTPPRSPSKTPPRSPPKTPPRSPPKDLVLTSAEVLPKALTIGAPQQRPEPIALEPMNAQIKPFFTMFRENYLMRYNVTNMTYRELKSFMYIIFPNVSFTKKITSMPKTDSQNFMHITYAYLLFIGLLNHMFITVTDYSPNLIMSGLKLVFKGGRTAQIVLPVGTLFQSDDTDILIMSSNPYHDILFLRDIAIEIAELFRFPETIHSIGSGKNPYIIKIAYKSSSGNIPISDIDFKYPEHSQFYQDIQIEKTIWNNIPLIYYHQSSESFIDEKEYINRIYADPRYRSCDCDIRPYTPKCASICGERQFYLDKFSKYMI